LIQGNNKVTLFINHSYPGGATIYVNKLIEERLARGEATMLLTYDLAAHQLKLISRTGGQKTEINISVPSEVETLLEKENIGEAFYNNLVTFPEPLEVVKMGCRLKRRRNCSLVFAIHDYHALCPSFNLLTTEGKFCNLPDMAACRGCLPDNFHVHVRTADSYDIDAWRKAWGGAFRLADKVVVFSESSRSLLKKVYPFLRPDQVVLQPHNLLTRFASKPHYNLQGPLKIGVVGDLGFHKGSQMVIDVAQILARKAPGTGITVIGKLDREAPVQNLEITGPFQTADLPALLEKYGINMCFFPSIWPETFSFVCSELMELGMPLCCYDLGAQGDRVRGYPLGRIIREINAEATVDDILQFYHSLRSHTGRSGTRKSAQKLEHQAGN